MICESNDCGFVKKKKRKMNKRTVVKIDLYQSSILVDFGVTRNQVEFRRIKHSHRGDVRIEE